MALQRLLKNLKVFGKEKVTLTMGGSALQS